ncbi:MAG: hypothetical protein U0V74_04735 [Chitinophagales bacterium]
MKRLFSTSLLLLVLSFGLIRAQDTILTKAQDTIKRTEFFESGNLMLIPSDEFPAIRARYFSFLAAGQDISAPGVTNIAADIADAKFTLTGGNILSGDKSPSDYIKGKNILLNYSLSADKEGSVASLFSDYKSGGNFDGEVKLHFLLPCLVKFKFESSELSKVHTAIRSIEREGERTKIRIDTEYLKGSDFIEYENLKALKANYNGWETEFLKAIKDSIGDSVKVVYRPKLKTILLEVIDSNSTFSTAAPKLFNSNNFALKRFDFNQYRSSKKFVINLDSVKQLYRKKIRDLDPLLKYNVKYDTIQLLIDKIDKQKKEIYKGADWTNVRMGWVTIRNKLGGQLAYTYRPDDFTAYYDSLADNNPLNDTVKAGTVKKNRVLTYSGAIEFNYYAQWAKKVTFYWNAGLGGEYGNNLAALDDVRDFSESNSFKDAPQTYGRSTSASKKYSAHVDNTGKGVISSWNLLFYSNLYMMFTQSQAIGVHLFTDYHNNFKSGADQINKWGLGLGMVANVPNKDKSKSLVGFEAYIKFNDVNGKGFKYNPNVEGQSEIGVSFNVPILTMQKN